MIKSAKIEYVDPSTLKEHELSHLIPEMKQEEWNEFLEDVENRMEIIKPLEVLIDGKVIDGRHRLKATIECNITSVPVVYEDMTEEEVVGRMRNSGLRRSLTHGQRATIILKCEGKIKELQEKAKDRQGERTDLKGNNIVPTSAQCKEDKKTRKILAEQARVGKTGMQQLMTVQKNALDLFDKVASGADANEE